MKDYPIKKKISLQGEYKGMVNDVATFEEYEVPIYDIPITKENFCRPYLPMETKDGVRMMPACINFNRASSCSICVKTARKIAKLNETVV